MKSFCNIVFALVLATFAGSSFAAGGKVFYAQVQGSIASTATSYTVTFFNNSPGPSTINSIKIVPPKSGNTALLTIVSVSPGSSALQPDGSVIVNNIPGIKRAASQVFTVIVNNVAAGCNAGTSAFFANAGNAYPSGDEFAADPTRMKTTSLIGCDFAGTVTCGDGNGFTTPQGGSDPNQSGYANFTVNSLKSGGACPAGTPYTISGTNTLGLDNKLAVTLSDPNAGFAATIVSQPLALDANGYASKRVQVAWEQDGSGNWKYIDAPTCLCSTAQLSCMPTDTVPTDPYFGQQVRACVADYSWVITSPGFAKYFATVLGFGGDPAMGWQ
jgi:hypothetical protein